MRGTIWRSSIIGVSVNHQKLNALHHRLDRNACVPRGRELQQNNDPSLLIGLDSLVSSLHSGDDDDLVHAKCVLVW
nr:hypothetical protein CFP56_56286 [Quercus suber]